MGNAINERVKKFRKFAGLSQEEVAKKLGIKTSTYSQMERNGNISAQTIMKLAAIFNVSPIDLLYEKNDPFAHLMQKSAQTEESTPQFESPRIAVDENGNFVFPEFALQKRQIDFVKKVFSLPKADQQDVLDYVQKKLDKYK